MEGSVGAFLCSLFFNLIILIGTIFYKYFGLKKLNVLFIPGGIIYLISFIIYLCSIGEYEDLYIWVKIGHVENLEKNDEKINKYLSQFSLYIITTHSFTIISIIYLIMLWNISIIPHLLIIMLSIIIGHQACYPIEKNDFSNIIHVFMFFSTFELIKYGIYYYN
jgi:hypothetical protein